MNTLASSAIELLRQSGIEVSIPAPGRAEVAGRSIPVFVRNRTPSPSEIERTDAALYLLTRLSPGLRLLAENNPNLTISAPATGEVWHQGKQLFGPRPQQQQSVTGKVNWARFGLLRALAATSKPQTQFELAAALGITQGAVSQNLANLEQLVVKERSGWRARSFDLVANEFLEKYPGPGGVEQGWFALDAVVPQGERVVKAHPGVLLSADSAADELAPYRKARTSMVYTKASMNLENLGFVRSERSRSTLIEIVPADRTIFPLAHATNDKSLVDGLLAVYDLRRSAGSDAIDASYELLIELREGWSTHAS